ncbi:potassium transporter 6-like [Aegilops tauschii subsp. strangulata]|uniref:potassium transporter 6-like n=1 Tax=Aegilops tauschii subsp. strangulata TaxID=200361 RepID=UPI00098A83C2|nr:potassium transporter 6-like [Aegilops tauschii subsp. strangulata]
MERRADANGDIVLEMASPGADGQQQGGDGGASGGRTLSFSQAYKMRHRTPQVFTVSQTLLLSFQSLGIVYGDLGTSPLYVFPSVVLPGAGERDFLGILSLILWTLTLMSLVKYVLIVLRADDHGEGGTFALYSLLRQHVNFKGGTPAQVTRLPSDLQLRFHGKKKRSEPSRMQKFLEGSAVAQSVLTYVVLVGTSMVMGDGALTPAISVLSAVQGIQSRSPKIEQKHVVMLSVVILLLLFLFQQMGTGRVSFSFSPIMLVWFGSIAMIGLYNIIVYYPPVLKAVNPYYIYCYFARNGTAGWEQLGAVILCITGAEAMFADLGHFNKRSIQVAFSTVVYPSLILAYAGQAAYLIKNPADLSTAFYSSIPGGLFWPMFVVATLAAIVASQSLISASFSIIRQSIVLDYFPRATVRHTSDKYEGQVYCPEVNYLLMLFCVLITIGFQGGPEIGHAFGVAVIWVMLITTALMTVVMVVIWDVHPALAATFFTVYVAVEDLYMSSLMNKLAQGGWVPFAITAFFLVITVSWTYGRKKKGEYEAGHMISGNELATVVARSARVPGVCFFFTDLMNGIPPIVRHYAEHTGCLRELLLFVTVRRLPVTSVLPEERFLVAAEEEVPPGVYRSVVQYGYMDKQDMEGEEFLESVLAALKEIARTAEEAAMMDRACRSGVSVVIGRTILTASGGKQVHGWFRRFIVNHMYRFLQKNFNSGVSNIKLDHDKTMQVGMNYKIKLD